MHIYWSEIIIFKSFFIGQSWVKGKKRVVCSASSLPTERRKRDKNEGERKQDGF